MIQGDNPVTTVGAPRSTEVDLGKQSDGCATATPDTADLGTPSGGHATATPDTADLGKLSGARATAMPEAGADGSGTGSAGDSFWHFYLQEHARPATRTMHIAGTTIALGCVVAAAILLQPWFLLAGLVAGYAFAWIGHFAFEHNRPATFKHPLASFAADWRMWFLAVTGRLGKELERHGLSKGS